MGLTYAIYIVNWTFLKKKLRYILIFFTDFKLLMFYNNMVKISEILNKWNLLNTCIQTTYPVEFCIFWS